MQFAQVEMTLPTWHRCRIASNTILLILLMTISRPIIKPHTTTIVDRALQEKRVLHERSERGGGGGDGGGLSPSLLCGVLDNKSKVNSSLLPIYTPP